jgi:hypothetical protein
MSAMRRMTSGRWLAGFVGGAILAAGCASVGPPPAAEQTPGAAEWRAYRAAVRDAAVAEPGEVRHDLVAITPSNPALEWRDGRVLVVTWSGWDGYVGKEGQKVPLGVAVWVTVADEVQERCRAYPPAGRQLRLEQLLGLPPGGGAGRRFVAMWAAPADVFRPCPDTEIDDTSCGLTAPSPLEHAEFLWNQTVGSYHLPDPQVEGPDPGWGYPWTRLGYTYDWGHPGHEVGLSEFVVEEGAEVVIESVEEPAVYCR